MVELDEVLRTPREHVKEIGTADVVIGALDADTPEKLLKALTAVQNALEILSGDIRAVVLHGAPGADHAAPVLQITHDRLHTLSYPLFEPDALADPVRGMSRAYRAVLAIAADLQARVSAVVSSNLDMVTAQWIYGLVRPVLELDFDLVTPCYGHLKFEALLTGSVLAPFTRALYGKQIQNPLGPDFGFSSRLLHRLLETSSATREHGRIWSWLFPASAAISAGMEICQSHLGVRQYPPTDWLNLSSAIAQILGPIFHEAEHYAAFWQRIRGSKPVPVFGEPAPVPEDTGAVETGRMIESFQLGCRSLLEVWGMILPPRSLMELRGLARVTPDRFRIPDELWARVVYDFALGYHLKTINEDHLLRSITPLYLAWVASFALEMEHAGHAEVEERLERLSLAYESSKPYFLSRWRWPDRFNP